MEIWLVKAGIRVDRSLFILLQIFLLVVITTVTTNCQTGMVAPLSSSRRPTCQLKSNILSVYTKLAEIRLIARINKDWSTKIAVEVVMKFLIY